MVGLDAGAAAMVACSSDEAVAEAAAGPTTLAAWRQRPRAGLADLGIAHVPSRASFVLAEVGDGVHAALRDGGIAVRRADTFPGLGPAWVRIAVRPPDTTDLLLRRARR